VGEQGGHVTVDNGAVGAFVAGLKCCQGLAAGFYFLAHALVDEHVGVHRHAQGEQDAGHAGQGEGGTHEGEDGEHDDEVHHQGGVREPAEQAVEHRHEGEHEDEAGGQREGAVADGVGAKFGAHTLFLDDVERGGQGAGAQQERQVSRRLWGEIAGNLARAAGDGLADDRSLDDFAVEDDGEEFADVSGGDVAELTRADGVEGEIDHPLAALRVGGGLGVVEVGAVDRDGGEHVHALLRVAGHGELRVAQGGDGAGRGVGVDHLEGHVCGGADEGFHAVRVGDAGELDDDLVSALAGDGGVEHA
jgi:hypothetical protein